MTVGLERPSSEQATLEHILTANDLNATKEELLRQPGWREGGEDGRASEAMLRLLLALREFHATYPALSLYAFDVPPDRSTPGARDEAMGKALLALREKKSQDLILVLTGNVHTFEAASFGYEPMAAFLPSEERLSLEVTDQGGESWTTWNGVCGASQNGAPAKGGNRPREIVLNSTLAPYGKVDGILSLGVPTTASAPAVGEISPVPECRKKFLEQHPRL